MDKKTGFRGYAFKKLLWRNLRYILLCMLPIVALLWILCAFQLKALRENALSQARALADKSAFSMDERLQEMVDISYALANSPQVGTLARRYDRPISQALRKELKEVQDLIKQKTVFGHRDADAMLAFLGDDVAYYVSVKSGWHYANIDANESTDKSINPPLFRMLWRMLPEGSAAWYADQSSLYYSYPIIRGDDYLGLVMSYMSFDALSERLATAMPRDDARLLIVKGDGTVAGDSRKDARGKAIRDIYPALTDGDGLFAQKHEIASVCWIESRFNGWMYAVIMPQESYRASRISTLWLFLSISAMTLLVLVLLAVVIARITCRPYEKILSLLASPIPVTPEEYARDYRPYDELGMISTLITQTRYQNMVLHTELSEQQEMLKNAQRAALQAQMSPHFLYNTLESINWLALGRLGEGNAVSEMVTRLARFSRVVTQSDEPLVTIEKEIEHARLYLDIQAMRFPDRFSIEWDVDETMLRCMTVRVSLQPLLENALKYGVLEVSDGRIVVSVRAQGEDILISVTDNGPGIEPEKLEALASMLSSQRGPARGVGLVNLHTRIRLIFGEAYGVSVQSAASNTIVSMTIPRRLS